MKLEKRVKLAKEMLTEYFKINIFNNQESKMFCLEQSNKNDYKIFRFIASITMETNYERNFLKLQA